MRDGACGAVPAVRRVGSLPEVWAVTDSNYRPEPDRCERCDGDGWCYDRPPCTTFDHNCACNGSFVKVACLRCDGAGVVEHPRQEQP